VDEERKKRIWKMLSRSEELDKFLGKKFPNLKRYGECSPTQRMKADADPRDQAARELKACCPLLIRCSSSALVVSTLPQASSSLMTVVGGLKSVVVALPHRGRLSLLCDPDLLGFSPTALFSKIKGKPEFDPETAPGATGDVISHLAATRQIKYEGGEVEVEVLQNPSHLEVGSAAT
jgi:probable 2-oxoglutarate dehydrogenase E1 component DHKTD1